LGVPLFVPLCPGRDKAGQSKQAGNEGIPQHPSLAFHWPMASDVWTCRPGLVSRGLPFADCP
jgi:hypothetical protein